MIFFSFYNLLAIIAIIENLQASTDFLNQLTLSLLDFRSLSLYENRDAMLPWYGTMERSPTADMVNPDLSMAS